jgi:hypothetical protein
MMCPTVRRPKNAPIDPVLIRDPKAPFSRARFNLISGNLGSQHIMPKPKQKKRI